MYSKIPKSKHYCFISVKLNLSDANITIIIILEALLSQYASESVYGNNTTLSHSYFKMILLERHVRETPLPPYIITYYYLMTFTLH